MALFKKEFGNYTLQINFVMTSDREAQFTITPFGASGYLDRSKGERVAGEMKNTWEKVLSSLKVILGKEPSSEGYEPEMVGFLNRFNYKNTKASEAEVLKAITDNGFTQISEIDLKKRETREMILQDLNRSGLPSQDRLALLQEIATELQAGLKTTGSERAA